VKCPGLVRLDVPDAAFASGVDFVVISFGATGALDDSVLVNLIAPSSSIGAGSVEYTITVQDNSSNPLDGAEVWVTTDEAGTNVVAGTLNTDALGLVTFLLDPGNYWVWVQHSGYNGTNPTSITVT
jgi:hypothetical protein